MKLRLSSLTKPRPDGFLARFQSSLQGQVLRLALPAVGEQLLSLMVGIVDTYLVGHLGQDAPIAAVGLANQWVLMATTLFSAVAVGTTAFVARAVGAEDWDLANRSVGQSVLLGVGIGLLTAALLVTLAGPAVTLLGAEADTQPLATTYLSIVGSILLFSSLMFICNAAMRGAGDTRTPFLIMLVVNGLNALIAWLLINGHLGLPRMGVAGSAVGAAVGRTVGGILAIVLLLRGRNGLRLSLRRLRPDLGLIRRIWRIALPSGAENVLFRTAQMLFFRVVAGLGTAAVAAQQIALNATSISFLPGFGFAVAATTLVGQSLGANDPRRAERSTYASFLWGGGLMVGIGLFLLFFPGAFMRFFTDSPAVIDLGIVPLRLIAVAQPLLAATMIFSGALRGAGDTRAPLWINASDLWLVRVPLATLFTQGLTVFFPTLATAPLPSWLRDGLGWGLPGAWTALVIDMSLRGLRMLLRFRAGRWKEIQV